MTLRFRGHIELPAHVKAGGFDHAAVHAAGARLYVAHTANDALDVIDCASDRYLHSIRGLTAVAGALVSDEHNLVFTSNRGENSVGIFATDDEAALVKVPVGTRPNGLSFDVRRGTLLAANVGDPASAGSFTLSLVDVRQRALTASIAVPGRTRWTIFDPVTDAFYVNISDPPQLSVVDARDLTRIARTIAAPAAGPHGLDLDPEQGRLFCACDARTLATIDARTGAVGVERALSGAPDVIFFHQDRRRLYVAIGDPGVIDVFDTATMTRVQVVPTETGAHTLALDAPRNKVYAFLPETHRAAVFVEDGD